MRHLYAPPQIEISGVFTGAFIDHLHSDEASNIFRKYHLENPDTSKWYPTHYFMDAMNELADQGHLISNLVAIGIEIGKRFPPVPNNPNPTLYDALVFWGQVYLNAHRHYNAGEIGEIRTEKVSDQHYKVILTDLYPDHFSYGIAYTIARKYTPKGHNFRVAYDPDIPTRDDYGGQETILHVTWE